MNNRYMPSADNHRARDCGVVVGLPLSMDDFRHGLQSSDPRSFSKSYEGKPWAFEPRLEVLRDSIRVVRSAGAEVFERASGADLAHAIRRFQVVVVFTHWRMAKIRAAEVVDAEYLVHKIVHGEDPTSLRLRAHAARALESGLLRDVATSMDLEVLFAFARRRNGVNAHGVWWGPVERVAVEEWANDREVPALAEDPPLEFFGVPPTLREIREAVSAGPARDRTIDLRVCSSVGLHAAIKRWRPLWAVISHRKRIEIGQEAIELGLLIGSLRRGRISYVKAMERLSPLTRSTAGD